MDKRSYIHYGNDHFDINKFEERKCTNNDHFYINKPSYGLWGSPVGAENEYFTWKEWCESEEYHTDRLSSHFIFSLKDTARVLTVTSMKDAENYMISDDIGYQHIDFEKVMHEYDAMELIHGHNYNELHMCPGLFNSWDVDSIVVWNPSVIIEERSDVQ